MHEVIMPRLGLTMKSGTIEKWCKKEGERVETGELLLMVMTDKVSLEVEADHSGVLRKIISVEGEEIPVAEVIAFIGDVDEEIPEKPEVSKLHTGNEKDEKKELQAGKSESVFAPKSKDKINISPIAVKAARELGIDYTQAQIKGTGPRGRIVKEDILAYDSARSNEGKG